MKTIILILTFLVSNQLIAKQKIYKWTDANGNVHYSENKPKNKSENSVVKEIKVSKGKSKPKVVNNDSPKEEVVGKEKSADQQAIDEYNKNEQARAAKVQKSANCKVAKKNLATLQATTRVRKLDPVTGEYVRMGDEQRVKSLQAAKKLISSVCK